MTVTSDPRTWGVALGLPALFADNAIVRMFSVTAIAYIPTGKGGRRDHSDRLPRGPGCPARGVFDPSSASGGGRHGRRRGSFERIRQTRMWRRCEGSASEPSWTG